MTSPLLGYNNNVRHKGQVFHIQTEDSGIKYPHVITHLFADGGRILKTLKTSYAEHLDSDRLGEIVRGLMKQQHKAMFVALRDGRFDRLAGIESGDGDPESSKPELAAESSGPKSSNAPRTLQRGQAPDLFANPPVQAPLDIETLERAAIAAQSTDARVSTEELLSTERAGEEAGRLSSGRYAQTRPASIFSAFPGATSIFGEELSERSLDEVILGYLEEDLGETELP